MLYEMFQLNGRGPTAWRNRIPMGYTDDLEEAKRRTERAGNYTRRFAVKLDGQIYVLASVYPVTGNLQLRKQYDELRPYIDNETEERVADGRGCGDVQPLYVLEADMDVRIRGMESGYPRCSLE